MIAKAECTAHHAASKLANKRVRQGLMSRDQAIQFTDWIYFMVSTGQLPDDPKQLALMEGEWKIATSEAITTAEIVHLNVS